MIRLTLMSLSVFILLSVLATAGEYSIVERAQKGDARAQFSLGHQYAVGDGVQKDSKEAIKWYRLAAEQGVSLAQFALGSLYAKGDGVTKDNAEAAIWYHMAAEQGYALAQFALGYLYANGEGVLKDSTEAVKWYRMAAVQGLGISQYFLGLQYASGNGTKKDAMEAVKWYRMAAMQDIEEAQMALARAYEYGEGVPKDAIESLAWSNIAARSGVETYIQDRNTLENRLGNEVTLLAQQRSKKILTEIEAAKQASISAISKTSTAPNSPATETPKASGSGAIVSNKGHVLTAAHVVVGASRVKVLTAQGIKAAKVLRIDEANDLAVLKLETGTYLTVPVASSRKIRLGQTVATIGFPNVQIQGFSPKVTRGEISSLNGIGDDPRAWQISVPVQPGNSGGPLLDENGNLVGVVVSKLGLEAAKAMGDFPQNVNYAVKSSYALALLEPYLSSDVPEPNQGKPSFEDMVAKAQQSVVLILVY